MMHFSNTAKYRELQSVGPASRAGPESQNRSASLMLLVSQHLLLGDFAVPLGDIAYGWKPPPQSGYIHASAGRFGETFRGAIMAGFEHHAAPVTEGAEEQTSARATRYGRILFVFYALLYGGFVLINAFDPALMQTTPLGGINLAVLYGLGLIFAAFALALFYDWLCRVLAKSPQQKDEAGK
jgi:uncharacterized membrane protein (DUF485 family)